MSAHVDSLFLVFTTVITIFCFTMLLPFVVLLVLVLMEYGFHNAKTAQKLLKKWKETIITHPYKDLPELTLNNLNRIKHEAYHHFSRNKGHLILLMILICLLNLALGHMINQQANANVISHWASIGIWIGLVVGKKLRFWIVWLYRTFNILRRNKLITFISGFLFGILAWFCVRAPLIGPWMLGLDQLCLSLGDGQGLAGGAYAGLMLGLKPRLNIRAGMWFGLLLGLLLGYFLQNKTSAILLGICFWRSFYDPSLLKFHIGWSSLFQLFLLILLPEVLYLRFSRIPVVGASLLTVSFFITGLLLFMGGITGNQPPADPLNSLSMSNACFDFISFIVVDHLLKIRKKPVAGWQVLIFGTSLVLLNYLLACVSLWLGLIPRIEAPWETVLSKDLSFVFSAVWTPTSPYFLLSNSVLLPTMLIVLILSFLTLSKFVSNTIIVDRLEKLIIINKANCFERLILFCCLSFLLIACFHDATLFLSEKFEWMLTGHQLKQAGFWLFLNHRWLLIPPAAFLSTFGLPLISKLWERIKKPDNLGATD